MTHSADSRLGAVACLLGAMACWASIPIFLRFFVSSQGLDPWAVNAVRYSVAATFWFPMVLVLGRRTREHTGSRAGGCVWRDALVPTAANVVAQATYGLSPAYASAPTIGFVLRLSFLFTLLFGLMFIHEERRLVRRPAFLAGAALCLAGVTALFVEGIARAGSLSWTGAGVLLLSTVGWGAYAVSVRRFMGGYRARLGFGVISLYTAGSLVVLALLFGRPSSLAGAAAGVWAAFAISAFLGIALGHVLYYRGIQRLGPVVSSGLLLATPFLTYAGAAVVLGETLTLVQTLGGVGVVAGGALLLAAEASVEPGLPAARPGPPD